MTDSRTVLNKIFAELLHTLWPTFSPPVKSVRTRLFPVEQSAKRTKKRKTQSVRERLPEPDGCAELWKDLLHRVNETKRKTEELAKTTVRNYEQRVADLVRTVAVFLSKGPRTQTRLRTDPEPRTPRTQPLPQSQVRRSRRRVAQQNSALITLT